MLATASMGPTFALEHFEHGGLVGRQRIFLNLLHGHTFESPHARGLNFEGGQQCEIGFHHLRFYVKQG